MSLVKREQANNDTGAKFYTFLSLEKKGNITYRDFSIFEGNAVVCVCVCVCMVFFFLDMSILSIMILFYLIS